MQKKEKLSDRITAELETMIINNMKDGDRLPTETELASSFGIGRSTIRESLKTLVAQGLIVRTNAGTVVTKKADNCLVDPLTLLLNLDIANVSDLLELRELLELIQIRLVINRATPEDILELERLHWQMQEPGATMESFQEKDIQFHNALAHATHNRVLEEVVKAIRLVLAKNQATACALPSIQSDAIVSHHSLIRAIKNRNEKAAVRAMEEHLKIARVFHGYETGDDGMVAAKN